MLMEKGMVNGLGDSGLGGFFYFLFFSVKRCWAFGYGCWLLMCLGDIHGSHHCIISIVHARQVCITNGSLI